MGSRLFQVVLNDWERLSHSGLYDMNRLKEAISLMISNDAPLPPELLDHSLKGKWGDHRECHIGGDFLLVYKIADIGKSGMVVFVRAGTHTELSATEFKAPSEPRWWKQSNRQSRNNDLNHRQSSVVIRTSLARRCT